MPVPFRDADEFEELGAAGFLKIEQGSSPSAFLAALFLVSARGEPLEFAYNRIETPNTVLWRPSDLRRYVERRLTASLLQLCSPVPGLLLSLAAQVGTRP